MRKRRAGRPAVTALLCWAALLCYATLVAGCAVSGSPPVTTPVTTAPTTTHPVRTAPTTTTTLPPPGNSADPAIVITPGRNLPDPFVLAVHGGYELYASQTSLYSEQIPTSFSRRLGGWKAFVGALPKSPSWAVGGFTWAPDVLERRGAFFVMYFDALASSRLYDDASASGLSARAQCIGVATARHAGGPFTAKPRPLVCDFSGHGAIDPRTFEAGGRLYLDWKADGNAATPALFGPTEIYAQLLSPNGLSLAG
ncbi:MAG: family 43 glycosylhydrolase, partial [Acidimicrobiales bacterium]